MNDHQDFTIHEALIRKESPFFEAALSRDWKEGEEKLVPMPEDRPDTFRLYVHWIYSRRIFLEPFSDPDNQNRSKHLDHLIRAYILGDKLLDLDFQDAIIDILINTSIEWYAYPVNHTLLAFQNTSTTSQFCCQRFCSGSSSLQKSQPRRVLILLP